MASSTFKKDAPIIKRDQFQYTVSSLAANTSRRVTAAELGYAAPEGYSVCGVAIAAVSVNTVTVRSVNATSGFVDIRNVSGSPASSILVTLTVSFIRSDLFEAI